VFVEPRWWHDRLCSEDRREVEHPLGNVELPTATAASRYVIDDQVGEGNTHGVAEHGLVMNRLAGRVAVEPEALNRSSK
jgi:hypothetical protein